MRPQRPKRRTLEYEVGRHLPDARGVFFGPLETNPRPETSAYAKGTHMSAELVSHFPRGGGGMALDLGCGTGVHRRAVEEAGFEWVGLDYDEQGALLFGDAHALPFQDQAVDFILSIAVLEHLRNPRLAMEEAYRVARPGCKLIGTVAFMETFHQNSFFHHSHLGVLAVLQDTEWTVTHVTTAPRWNSLTAQAQMGLFPRMPAKLSRGIVTPVQWLHRLWWKLGALKSPNITELQRQLTTSGAFTFIAYRT
jgi:SAM-dependent methyltransferase